MTELYLKCISKKENKNYRKGLQTPTTLKCLSIGTLKIIDFPFVPNGKSMVLGVPIFKPNIFRL